VTANRLDFARWLVSDEQPLTPRVTVNRVWQQFFARGFVETENDFGVQGSRPTHPELLDWVATRFIQSGWNMKSLHRLLVSSATYRQSSRRRSNVDSIDDENRLLSRQSRVRLDAETIRDCTLAASELLSDNMGGKSVFPHQQEGILINRATPATWTISPGTDRYRRSLYTYFWRLTPHPYLQTFDAPDSLTSCTRRKNTNTPIQALTLLNDPMFVECAMELADRVISTRQDADTNRQPSSVSLDSPDVSDDRKNIAEAFQSTLNRLPTDRELSALQEILQTARDRFTSGQSSADRSAIERHAWIQVGRVLFNLDEFIVRE
ncbi:MAG: DUF1553 domain-containing protein, partial [Planctomycetes bacterium]|nr:DUF1553 domain-containing protein [Planctomycetota bacterium]